MDGLLIVLILVLLIILYTKSKTAEKLKNDWERQQAQLEKEKKQVTDDLSIATDRINKLSKYEVIVDAEIEAQRIIINAETVTRDSLKRLEVEVKAAHTELNAELAKERADIALLKAQANARKSRIEADYEAAIIRATDGAREIVESAQNHARELGTYTVEQAKDMQATLTAVENRIHGYGEKYLKSSYSIMDDLADEFGYKEAGEKLKTARDVTKVLISSGRAATCNYVESERKNTAINFVLDAFNGKVEVILSRIKRDNYGILEQQIKDAYSIINMLGKAFRNAAITEEYLTARLSELKWASILQELKWKDAEEQRLIREQIREEEKARKEYERAIRDAQKEEETLKKLIEKAQQLVKGANEAQRAQYEERLRDLEGKLIAAEEKNQRALSMAQQTKSGNVYVISNIGSFGEEVFKIGMTRRLEPLDRVRELGDASVPFEFDVHALIYSEDAPRLERELHKKFLRAQMNKVNPRKEFFRVTLTAIRNEVESLGIDAVWTMAAEARQYRESLALEQELARDATLRVEWEQKQMDTEKHDELTNVESIYSDGDITDTTENRNQKAQAIN